MSIETLGGDITQELDEPKLTFAVDDRVLEKIFLDMQGGVCR